MPDEALACEIRRLPENGPLHGEDHRKVWGRLRVAGIRTSPRRVLRVLRARNGPDRRRKAMLSEGPATM